MKPSIRVLIVGLVVMVVAVHTFTRPITALGRDQFVAASTTSEHTHRGFPIVDRLLCTLPKEDLNGRVTVTAQVLSAPPVFFLRRGRDESYQLYIHQSVLDGMLQVDQIHGIRDVDKFGPYLRYDGVEITSEDDKIVANFERHTVPSVGHKTQGARTGMARFAGFKVLLGRRPSHDSEIAGTDLNIYFRIIVDWSSQIGSAKEKSLYRAAYVASQVSAGSKGQGVQESFYRFLPNLRPFQVLTCVSGSNLEI